MVSRDEVLSELRRLLVEQLDLTVSAEQILESDHLYAPHIALDSLGYQRLVVALEEVFAIRIDEDVLFETVRDVIDHVLARAGATTSDGVRLD